MRAWAREPRGDPFLGHIYDHQIVSKRQRAIVVFTNLALNFARGIEIVLEVKRYSKPRANH